MPLAVAMRMHPRKLKLRTCKDDSWPLLSAAFMVVEESPATRNVAKGVWQRNM